MADASYTVNSFLGGLWSKAMQGRVDRPDYKTGLNECLNSLPNDQGAHQRRSGTGVCFGATTRSGAAGRVISFDFNQAAPYNVEFTNGHLRFFNGFTLATTNDSVGILAISAANPAVVQTSGAVTWVTGDQGFFLGLGTTSPLLQNRVFALTKIDTTHFSLADAVTGAPINGATLGFAGRGGATFNRVLDLSSPYIGENWASLRIIPADIPIAQGTTPGAVLLNATIKPYVLQVVTLPSAASFATFTLAPAAFKDGPYLDPVPGGTLATPSALSGNINITLAFNTYDATRSYSIGDYALFSGNNYRSLTDANINNQPDTHPANWVLVTAADAIGPNGFVATDIGRMVRLLSAPPLWVAATAYSTGAVVAYGTPETYWTALTSTTGNIPGTDLTHWGIATNAIRWTWGKITGLSNIIDRALAGSVNIGDMTASGGIAAAFNGVFSQSASAGAEGDMTGGPLIAPVVTTLVNYIGKNYSGASAQKISGAAVYPSNDIGAAKVSGLDFSGNPILNGVHYLRFTRYTLRAKATAPVSATDGTILGQTAFIDFIGTPQIITSNDQVTAWNYVWIEVETEIAVVANISSFLAQNFVAQVSFFNPPGAGTSQGFTMQIIGDALLYNSAVRTWRLGVYSDTLGWPTCGTYHEGRLWLSGVVSNRFDGSKSNDVFNFAPTNPDGSVSDNNAIDYRMNAPDVNPIFWMSPEEQGIVMGTQPGEWLVQATTLSAKLTPTSIQAHRNTRNGCANIEPRRTDHTLIVVQKFRRKALEYFPDVFSGKYSAQDIFNKGKVLTEPFIAEIAYQQELTSIVWARMDDGSLAGVTYKRETLASSQEATAGAHRHVLGSGRIVESITMGATADGNLDALAMVTNDPATNIRHVEIMQTMWEESDPIASAWFLDDAVRPSSTVANPTTAAGAPYGGMTLNGLWHLNGKTVQVFAGGLDCGDPGEGNAIVDFVVANGSVFVPFGDGISAGSGAGLFTEAFAIAAAAANTILVGFTYTSDGQVLPPYAREDTGARNGPGAFKTIRSAWYGVRVFDTAGLSIGTDFTHLNPVLFKDATDTSLGSGQLFNGDYRDFLGDDYSFSSKLCWRSTRPLPANISMVGAMPHTQDV